MIEYANLARTERQMADPLARIGFARRDQITRAVQVAVKEASVADQSGEWVMAWAEGWAHRWNDGWAEGWAEGSAQAGAEGREAIRVIAAQLLAMGVDSAIVAEATGLGASEINRPLPKA
jgi:hypothetical protein